MTRCFTPLLRLRLWALVFLLMGAAVSPALAAELKLDVQLIWGTNDDKSPDPKHKPIGPNTQKKLKTLPFKWTSYFEVTRQQVVVSHASLKKVTLSKELEIQIKNLGNDTVEVVLFGKGQRVGCIKQALPKGELLVAGGNAENFTAWFVVLKQSE